MSRRDRDRKPARRSPHLTPKKRILVVCDGEVTEPQYLEGFKHWVRNPLVDVKTEPHRGGPQRVVDQAIRLRAAADKLARAEADDNARYDEVWCATDVDDFPDVEQARQRAQAEDIGFALSNPCVELWLLLHFRESPGPQARKDLARMMGRHIPGYNKQVDFATYQGGYVDAVRRAQRLARTAEEVGESAPNPSTGFFALTERIRGETPLPGPPA